MGCAENPKYVYEPEAANAQTSGLPATKTAIPQEAPQGAIEIASYGVTELRPGGVPERVLHVREIVTNDGDARPWQVDTREQLVDVPDAGQAAARYVNTDQQSPVITVGQHEQRVLDFYFPLPAGMEKDSRLPGFQVLWNVHTGSRAVASRTAFDRVAEQPDVAYVYEDGWPYWAGSGPYWWYGYPRVAFHHARAHQVVVRDHRR
jgi:hypothetical protein